MQTTQSTQTTQIMRSKSHTRTDVQWIISSVSLAVTLGLWGLLASAQKKGAGVEGTVQVVQPPDPVVVTTTSQPQTLLPGQVLLLGGAVPQPPQQQTVVTSSAGTTTTKHHSGGGSPAASTHSSHP